MPLVQLVITLIVVGVLLGAMNTYIPMDPKIRNIINLVVVVAVVLWLLKVFGVLDYARGIRVGAWQTGHVVGAIVPAYREHFARLLDLTWLDAAALPEETGAYLESRPRFA